MSEKASKKISRRKALAATVGAAAAVGTVSAAVARPRRSDSLLGKRVLVCLGDFSEGMESYYMIYRLMEEGIKPVVAAESVKLLHMVVHDFEADHTNYTEKAGYTIQTDIAYRDVNPSDYDGLLIPGGRGPEEIRQYQEALDAVGYFLDKKLPLGAMCHGPQVIYAARSCKGREMAAYSALKPDVELSGAKYVDEAVVIDGAMVTSRGWPDLPAFMPAFLDVLAKG